jgi:hydroxymethylbilane synthase
VACTGNLLLATHNPLPAMTKSLPKTTLVLGTRTSNLARWQTDRVVELLQAAWPGLKCEIRPFQTQGDKILDKPLPQIGGKGLFTAELEQALLQGHIDLAVHSLKDLPTDDTPGLTVGAITDRADARDGLVARNGLTLANLPHGALIGTSSVRRQAQLLARRPDLRVTSIRGNVETRLRKVLKDHLYDATILAAAGLERLGLTGHVTEWLDYETMLPAPGQGALAVQCRARDQATLTLLAAIDNWDVRTAVTAERAFLNVLESGCSAPVAALATIDGRTITMRALVASPSGQRVIGVRGEGRDPQQLGQTLARQVVKQGAGQILARLQAGLPLRDKRIVVTRPLEQARSFHDMLVDLGAQPLLIPAIHIAPAADIAPLHEALHKLERYDWLIFTSVNGVKIFWQALESLGYGADHLNPMMVAAVGEKTADALQARGVTVDFVPQVYVAEAIATGLGNLRGQHVLLPVAARSRETLPDLLAAQGAQVTRLDIYETLPPRLDAAQLAPLADGVDVITFTSSSTVENLVTAVAQVENGRFLPYLQAATIACIGPKTAVTARDLGLSVDLVAAEHTMEGLVEALLGYFRDTGNVLKVH